MTRRDETLRSASEAATALAESHIGARTSFDVISVVAERNIPLLFRPLNRLWGAFITIDDDECGSIVSTRLGLPAQRFTVAHELGHLMLGHRTTSGASSTRTPKPKSSASDHRIAHTLMARDRRACCTSGSRLPACTILSSNTSGRGTGQPSPASRSTSTGTAENVRVGRAASEAAPSEP